MTEAEAGREAIQVMAIHTITALQKYMEERGASQVAVARACGFSSPVISQILHGEYKGDMAKVLKAIQDFLALEEEREESFTSSKFVRTGQADDVLIVCSLAHTNKFIGLVQARAGLGKTSALNEYASRRSGVCFITASTWNCSRGAIALLLTRAVRVSTTYTTMTSAVEEVINKLGGGSLVIIDEAQHLTRETLDGLRYIHDMAKVGVVLSGTVQVSARMSDKRIGINYEQLASRIGIRRTLSETIAREDVKRILCQAAPNANGEVLNYCCQKANSPGAYRTMMRYIQVAVAKANAKKETVGLKHFQAAEEILMV